MFIQSVSLLQATTTPPANLYPWLTHPKSLTDKLKNQTGDAQLKLLNQSWSSPNWWDKFTLGITDQKVMHRDILMFSQHKACWFARTIIPYPSYQAERSFFDKLKYDSLGTIIYADQRVKRNVILNYAITSECIEFCWLPPALAVDNECWVRLSVFTILEAAPFYLVEIFLPYMLEIIN